MSNVSPWRLYSGIGSVVFLREAITVGAVRSVLVSKKVVKEGVDILV